MASSLRIDVDRPDALADEQVFLTVSGAHSGERVHLHSRLTVRDGDLWESTLVFVANEQGVVELASASPVSGEYSEPHAMGFLWSMSETRPPEGAAKPTLVVASPLLIDVEAHTDDGQRVAITLTRRFMGDGVRRKELREHGLIGTLFEPEGPRPNPVVVCLGGSEGGLNEARAALYASHGFATLALAYFGVEPLPLGAREIPLEYFKTAFDYLLEEEICNSGSIAIDGGSYGGQLVLLLAATFPEVSCTIANVPSGLVHSSVDTDGHSTVTSAFTYEGKPLPFVTFDPAPVDWKAPEIELTPGYAACLTQQAMVAATIPVENAQCPILMLNGADDSLWPSKDLTEVAAARLRDNNYPHYFEHISYADAGHTATATPYAPCGVTSVVHPVVGLKIAFGGTPLGNLRASEDAWRRSLDLLKKTIGRVS